MARPRVILGLLCAATTANALLAPAVAPRRAAALHVIETAPEPTEQEIFSEATSISGALAELWSILANPPPPGDFRAMYFPNCEGLKRPQTFQALFEHLEVCKDSSQNFGAHIHAMPGPGSCIIVKNVPRSTNADVWDEWADEDEDDDFLSPEMRERLKALDAETAPPVDKCPIQHDLGDDDALKCSKDWVNAIVSDAGICPFSLSADRAGLPLGDVRYDVTRADDTETCFQWFWKEVKWLEDHPRHATSLLLMTNPYWASNFDAFEQFGDALTQALQSATESKVEGLGFEGQIQLVFFHPQYVFRLHFCLCGNQPVS